MAPEVMARAEPPRHRVGRSEHTHIGCLPDPFLRAYGLPHYLKFVQTPDLLVMLNEYNGVYRQIFTDGRPLPEAPNPSWQGYSTATWSDDTLVIDTIGFRDDLGSIGTAA